MIGPIGVVVVVSLLISFFCSLSEASLYSIPAGKIEQLTASGSRSGRILHHLRENIDQPIAAILILNTVANTVGAALAGALVDDAYGSTALAVFSAAFTLAILWCSEIVPKTLGVYYAETAAPLVAPLIAVVIKVVWPLVWASEKTVRLVKPRQADPKHTEEDILSIARLGLKSGAILPQELAWVGNVLHLNDVVCRDIMTPRPVVSFLQKESRLGDVKDLVLSLPFSRIPVVEEKNLDTTCGLVARRRILEAIITGHDDATVGSLMWPTHFVPESMRGHVLLEEFFRKKHHLFMVVDEHGGVEGLVTLEDVLEAMLGRQIVDEFDRHEDMKELARRKAEVRKKQIQMD